MDRLAVNTLWLNEMGPYRLRGMPPLNVRFGRAVTRLRKRADFSQERFANAIVVHRTTIGMF